MTTTAPPRVRAFTIYALVLGAVMVGFHLLVARVGGIDAPALAVLGLGAATVSVGAYVSGLRALVWSPQLSMAAIALPYHERLLSLRAPGALRMGGREAAVHLGIPLLDRADEREVAAGLERCREAVRELGARGHDVLVGSGAPGAGCAPGLAALDENAALAVLGGAGGHSPGVPR